MAVLLGGNSAVPAEVDAATSALRTTQRPMQILGAYTVSLQVTGLGVGLVAGADVAAFRWTSATNLALLQRIRVRSIATVAFSVAQKVQLTASIVTNFTTGHSSGAIVTTGTALRRRQSYPVSSVGSINVSTGSALAGATRTLSPNPFVSDSRWVAGVGSHHDMGVTFNPGNAHPIVLAQNEGVLIQNGDTIFGAGGTMNLTVDFDWVEIEAFNYSV